jgi:ATP-dependent Clp protease adapter protein ClpS
VNSRSHFLWFSIRLVLRDGITSHHNHIIFSKLPLAVNQHKISFESRSSKMISKLSNISLLFLLFGALCLTQAFTFSGPATPFGIATSRDSISQLFAGFGKDKDGGAALAKPKVNIGQKTAVETKTKQKVEIKRKVKPAEPVQRREDDFEEAPLFKLMLIGDDGYDLTHVVERLCAIVDDMDEDQAANVFQQANQEGKAMCGKYPFERAELFKEQLQRSDPMIFSDLEEENK